MLWLLVSGFENSNEMSRSISWRRVCPDFVNTRIEEAYEKVVYIVHQTGPTGFVLKQEGEFKKFKVYNTDITSDDRANPLVFFTVGITW